MYPGPQSQFRLPLVEFKPRLPVGRLVNVFFCFCLSIIISSYIYIIYIVYEKFIFL
jgi:hypothetical protein